MIPNKRSQRKNVSGARRPVRSAFRTARATPFPTAWHCIRWAGPTWQCGYRAVWPGQTTGAHRRDTGRLLFSLSSRSSRYRWCSGRQRKIDVLQQEGGEEVTLSSGHSLSSAITLEAAPSGSVDSPWDRGCSPRRIAIILCCGQSLQVGTNRRIPTDSNAIWALIPRFSGRGCPYARGYGTTAPPAHDERRSRSTKDLTKFWGMLTPLSSEELSLCLSLPVTILLDTR